MRIKTKKEWEELYNLQDEILFLWKDMNNIVLAGGSGINRYLLKKPLRYSEDLDIFIEPPFKEGVVKNEAYKLKKLIEYNSSKIILNDENFENFFLVGDNVELKIKVLNINCKRFVEPLIFNNKLAIEDPKELILYKFAAIADRSTIRDLFDIYVLLKLKIHSFDIDIEIEKLNKKLNKSYGYNYSAECILLGIKNTNISKLNVFIDLTPEYKDLEIDFIKEIKIFKDELLSELLVNNELNYNLFDKLKKVKDTVFLDDKEDINEYLSFTNMSDFSKLEKRLILNEYDRYNINIKLIK